MFVQRFFRFWRLHVAVAVVTMMRVVVVEWWWRRVDGRMLRCVAGGRVLLLLPLPVSLLPSSNDEAEVFQIVYEQL
jgi:hypothetical protein